LPFFLDALSNQWAPPGQVVLTSNDLGEVCTAPLVAQHLNRQKVVQYHSRAFCFSLASQGSLVDILIPLTGILLIQERLPYVLKGLDRSPLSACRFFQVDNQSVEGAHWQ